MEFDKTRVFTPFNCDEVKIGSKGYFADYKDSLIARVQLGSEAYLWTLDSIVLSDNDYVFSTNKTCKYHYFYLVEEPKEKTRRPCTREELVEMLKKQGLSMLKTTVGNLYFTIESISDNNVFMGSNYSYKRLCNEFTLLDGTPLWVEE